MARGVMLRACIAVGRLGSQPSEGEPCLPTQGTARLAGGNDCKAKLAGQVLGSGLTQKSTCRLHHHPNWVHLRSLRALPDRSQAPVRGLQRSL